MFNRELVIEGKNVTRIVKALSNEVRINILNILSDGECSINSLTEMLKLSKTAVLAHINILEETGFISTYYLNGSIGNQKICKKVYDKLTFNFTVKKYGENSLEYIETSTPVGNFFDFNVYPPCGLASQDHIIKKWDDPEVFVDIERVKAGLLWSTFGFINYKFPLKRPFETQDALPIPISALEITLEISACGDIVQHRMFKPPAHIPVERITEGISDITFWLNGIEIGTHTTHEFSRGNYYADKTKYDTKSGKYTPKWWKGSYYGELLIIDITKDGTFINKELTSDYTIDDFKLTRGFVDFKLGIKEDAKNISGFNIYGAGFGNYPDDIVMRIF